MYIILFLLFTGVKGVFFATLSVSGLTVSNPAAQCIRWYRSTDRSLWWRQNRASQICPCNLGLMRFDSRFFLYSFNSGVWCYVNYRFTTSRVSKLF